MWKGWKKAPGTGAKIASSATTVAEGLWLQQHGVDRPVLQGRGGLRRAPEQRSLQRLVAGEIQIGVRGGLAAGVVERVIRVDARGCLG